MYSEENLSDFFTSISLLCTCWVTLSDPSSLCLPICCFSKMKILSFHGWESWKKIDSRLCKSLLHRNFGCRYCQLSSLIISDWSTAVAELGACLNVSVILGTYVYRLKKHKVNPIHDIYWNKQIRYITQIKVICKVE